MRSVNQNHQLYVVKAIGNPKATNAAVGTIQAVASGSNPMERDIYFLYRGHDGVTRSDLIPVNLVTYVKRILPTANVSRLRTATVSLDSAVNGGDIKVGADYVLNISFQQFYGLSPEDTYVKTVAVRATSAMSSAADLFTEMVAELKRSFSREVGADAESNPYLDFEVSGNNLVITEKEQPWTLGKYETESLYFEVIPSTIYLVDEGDVTWGTVTYGTSNTTIPNSKKMADLEWFTFGERADIYRGMGYPNNFDFKPLIDPDNAEGYSSLEIHYAYQGTCEDIQKSEKDITIVGSEANIETLAGTLAGATYLNTTIPFVPVS